MNFRYGLTTWMDAGVGYVVNSNKFLWSIRLQPIREGESSWIPSIIVGTGSVQTGGSDQSAFLFITKATEFMEGISARVSLGIASLFPKFNKAYFLFNLTMTLTEKWSPFFNYDGINFHYGLSFLPRDWIYIGFLMVESKNPAILLGMRWNLKRK